MRTIALPIVLIAAIGLGACSQTTQRVGGGAAIGAGVGAVGTAITGGCIPCGAAIGAGAGAVGGYIYDQHKKGKL
jgi:osmotically inducible lipoprotein OsmB